MTPPVKPRIAEHIADSLFDIAMIYKRQTAFNDKKPKSLKAHSLPKPVHIAYNAGSNTARVRFKVKKY